MLPLEEQVSDLKAAIDTAYADLRATRALVDLLARSVINLQKISDSQQKTIAVILTILERQAGKR